MTQKHEKKWTNNWKKKICCQMQACIDLMMTDSHGKCFLRSALPMQPISTLSLHERKPMAQLKTVLCHCFLWLCQKPILSVISVSEIDGRVRDLNVNGLFDVNMQKRDIKGKLHRYETLSAPFIAQVRARVTCRWTCCARQDSFVLHSCCIVPKKKTTTTRKTREMWHFNALQMRKTKEVLKLCFVPWCKWHFVPPKKKEKKIRRWQETL